MDFPSFQDVKLIARDEVLAQNRKITAEAIDLAGTDAFALISAMAAVGDELSGQLARLQAALLLGAARGGDLTRLAFDRYGVVRKAAAPAVGSVVFSLPTPSVSSFSIPNRTLISSVDGTQFITTEDAVFPAAATSSSPVAVRATVAGLATQAQAGTLTNIISAILGSPVGLAVTNSLATAGAADEESDDSLRSRALAFFSTARRGTVSAIRQGALTVSGVETAQVIEVLDSLGRPAKTLQLVVADQFTEALAQTTSVPPAYAIQSQVLGTAVFDALVEYRAAGIFVDVIIAKVVMQGVLLSLNFKAGADTDFTALQARAAIVNYINALPPGQSFKISEALDALRRVPGLLVTGSEIMSPVGDVIPLPLEVLRTSMGIVVASTVQPDRRLASTANPDAVGL